MTEVDQRVSAQRPVLYAMVCGAAPAVAPERLVRPALTAGWDVWVIATRTALDYFFDPEPIERLTGHPVRSGFRRVGEPGGLPRAAAAVVAPATYNTINKWAAGIADSFMLSTLGELTGARVPIAALPFVNTSFAATAAFKGSVAALRSEGVKVLLGPDGFEPYQPGAGEAALAAFPWQLAVEVLPQPEP